MEQDEGGRKHAEGVCVCERVSGAKVVHMKELRVCVCEKVVCERIFSERVACERVASEGVVCDKVVCE